jgi:sugar/nucleoside kinase (ribokinase family)
MVWVVGAACLDVVASRARFLPGTSNPARITAAVGGVANRIYQSLASPKRLLTATGDDELSLLVRRSLAGEGVEARVFAGAGPPVYVALMERGSLAFGACDAAAVERLSAADLAAWIGEPDTADLLVLDANLSPGLVREAVERFAGRLRIAFEPVSVEKAARHRDALRGVYLVTPDEAEAAALAGGSIAELPGWMRAGRVAHALVTRGPRGASLFSLARGRTDYPPGRVVETDDTTGAGDRLLASVLDAVARGVELPEAVTIGMREVEASLVKGSA